MFGYEVNTGSGSDPVLTFAPFEILILDPVAIAPGTDSIPAIERLLRLK